MMSSNFNSKPMGLSRSLSLSCLMALGLVSATARAQIDPANAAYLTDQRGAVVLSGYGLCWHTGYGPAAMVPAECNADAVPTPVVNALEPAPPRAAVAPLPAVAAQPAVRPASEKVTLAADTLFDFDKAVLRPAGRAALDEFVGKLKGVSPEVISIVGHADRLGSAAYNQRLSAQRAAAVKSYLVERGIDSGRLQTAGKGEAEPVTQAGQCVGGKSAKVIACLQPDRRVEIELIGTGIAKP